MFDLVDLQHKLEESRGEVRPPSRIRMRTAKQDDAAKLLNSGLFTQEEISYFLGISPSIVQAEQARIEERVQAKRRYMETLQMDLPGTQASFTIYQT